MNNCDFTSGFGLGHGSYLGLVGVVLVLLLTSYVGVKIFRHFSAKNGRGSDRNDSLNIARMRYAKGEISDEEYAQIKKVLRD